MLSFRIVGQFGLIPITLISLVVPILKADNNTTLPSATLIATPDKCVTSLLGDTDGTYWVGSEIDGLYHMGLDDKPLAQFSARNGLGETPLYPIAMDAKNRIWVGHLHCGISVFNRSS
jgi:ligand-binding sensor domain-containing protein